MRFLIAGAGAIGAYIGARMANAGFDVTLFARGPHLRAMQEHGVRVKSNEGDFVARPKLAASFEEVGPVDVAFLAVKAHSLPQLAPHLRPVLGRKQPSSAPRMASPGGISRASAAIGKACAWNVSTPAA